MIDAQSWDRRNAERWRKAAGIPCPDCPFLTKTKETSAMDPNSGAIAQFESEEDAERAGYTEPLNDKEARLLATMNRHDRRAWLSRRRKEQKARGGVGGRDD